jgi:predicted Ser/Thr protein kinase
MMTDHNHDNTEQPTVLDQPTGMVGRKLGHYKVEAVLAKGGMGVVYRAHDVSLDRKVVLKVLLPGLSHDPDFEKRLIREARAAAKVSHPNIVQVYFAGRTQGVTFVVMEYIDGPTLAEKIKQDGRLSVEEALRLTLQVSRALEAAHAKGVIHRDIKPGNIMLDAEGNAKVMDFGIARLVEGGVTQIGVFLGTPEYSSPEQCGGLRVDERSDLYSLGVLLYEMLTGRVPHVAETPSDLFKKIAEEDPIPIRDLNEQVPVSVVDVMEGMLEKSPDRRPPSAAQLSTTVFNLLRKIAGPDYASGAVLSVPEKVRSAFPWIGVAAAVLAVVVAGAWWMGGDVAPEPTPQPEVVEQPVDEAPVPQRTMRVAFFDFRNMTGSPDYDWMEIGVPDFLGIGLGQHGQIEWIPRDRVVGIREDGRSIHVDEHFLGTMESLGADVVIGGSIAVVEEKIHISVRVLRAPGAEQIAVYSKHGPRAEIFDMVDAIVAHLKGVVYREAGIEDEKAASGKGERKVAQLLQERWNEAVSLASAPAANRDSSGVTVRPASFEKNSGSRELSRDAGRPTQQNQRATARALTIDEINLLLPEYYDTIASLDLRGIDPAGRRQIRDQILVLIAEGVRDRSRQVREMLENLEK